MPSRNPEIRQAAVAGGAAASKQHMSDLDKLAALAAHCSNSNPPSVAITEGAWERIVDKLMAGEPAYTYSNFCPHGDRDQCQCPKRVCFIEGNKLYGTRDGVTLPLVVVHRVTDADVGRLRRGGLRRDGDQ